MLPASSSSAHCQTTYRRNTDDRRAAQFAAGSPINLSLFLSPIDRADASRRLRIVDGDTAARSMYRKMFGSMQRHPVGAVIR